MQNGELDLEHTTFPQASFSDSASYTSLLSLYDRSPRSSHASFAVHSSHISKALRRVKSTTMIEAHAGKRSLFTSKKKAFAARPDAALESPYPLQSLLNPSPEQKPRRLSASLKSVLHDVTNRTSNTNKEGKPAKSWKTRLGSMKRRPSESAKECNFDAGSTFARPKQQLSKSEVLLEDAEIQVDKVNLHIAFSRPSADLQSCRSVTTDLQELVQDFGEGESFRDALSSKSSKQSSLYFATHLQLPELELEDKSELQNLLDSVQYTSPQIRTKFLDSSALQPPLDDNDTKSTFEGDFSTAAAAIAAQSGVSLARTHPDRCIDSPASQMVTSYFDYRPNHCERRHSTDSQAPLNSKGYNTLHSLRRHKHIDRPQLDGEKMFLIGGHLTPLCHSQASSIVHTPISGIGDAFPENTADYALPSPSPYADLCTDKTSLCRYSKDLSNSSVGQMLKPPGVTAADSRYSMISVSSISSSPCPKTNKKHVPMLVSKLPFSKSISGLQHHNQSPFTPPPRREVVALPESKQYRRSRTGLPLTLRHSVIANTIREEASPAKNHQVSPSTSGKPFTTSVSPTMEHLREFESNLLFKRGVMLNLHREVFQEVRDSRLRFPHTAFSVQAVREFKPPVAALDIARLIFESQDTFTSLHQTRAYPGPLDSRRSSMFSISSDASSSDNMSFSPPHRDSVISVASGDQSVVNLTALNRRRLALAALSANSHSPDVTALSQKSNIVESKREVGPVERSLLKLGRKIDNKKRRRGAVLSSKGQADTSETRIIRPRQSLSDSLSRSSRSLLRLR